LFEMVVGHGGQPQSVQERYVLWLPIHWLESLGNGRPPILAAVR
jgi:hypothetical protein